MMFHYTATLDRVIDGDTYILDVDLGFRIHAKLHIRALGVDTPDRGEVGYDEATAFVTEFLTGKSITILTEKDKTTFERWLAWVYADGHSVDTALIKAGLGVLR